MLKVAKSLQRNYNMIKVLFIYIMEKYIDKSQGELCESSVFF